MKKILFILLFLFPSIVYSYDIKSIKYDEDFVYYSDDYFRESSLEYNSHLASLSMIMGKYSAAKGTPSNINDANWYKKQPNRLKEFFKALNFNSFEANEDYYIRPNKDTIGIAIAKKDIDDFTLIAIAPRSANYFNEWGNNFILGDGSKSDNMHEGFYNASNRIIDFLEDYLDKYETKSKIKIWMAGYSRGGAVSNITGGLLDNIIDKENKLFNKNITLDDLYVYTFGTPQGANIYSKSVKSPKDKIYNNIFNMLNPNDITTKVGMSEFGFTRFGIDKYIANEFYDPDNYDNNRLIFKIMYSINNKWNNYTGDDLTMYNSNGIDKSKVNFDSNILSNILLEEVTNIIGSRDEYCSKYQNSFRDLASILRSDDLNERNDIVNYLKGLFDSYLGDSSGSFKILGDSKNQKITYSLLPIIKIALELYKIRPNEVISIAKNASNIFDNHFDNVLVAHAKSQDSYYIDSYNKSHNTNYKPIELLDNVDYGIIVLNGFNDIELLLDDELKINIEGYVSKESIIKKCDLGYIVNYNKNKIELFIPVNNKYNINIKSYSKKLKHDINYKVLYRYSYLNNNKIYKVLDSYNNYGILNTNRLSIIESIGE